MYIHIGNNYIINFSDIIGIFDIENTSISKHTKEFFKNLSEKGNVINVSDDIPKSFILVKNNKDFKIYISNISSLTIKKRSLIK